ncbi:MAG: hypothetical protein MUF43_13320 [Flavobacterium sp.]|jgi:hypothetical protein|nr:hypothetical protein [Flavobacterium sp.]
MKSIIVFLVIFYSVFSYSQKVRFEVVNSNTFEKLSEVNVCVNDSVIVQSSLNGTFEINKDIKEIILKKPFYYDRKIFLDSVKDKKIELEPIISYLLNEVEVVFDTNEDIFKTIYSNYTSRKNYNINFFYENFSINLKNDDCEIINMNEVVFQGYKLRKNKDRILRLKRVYYDLEFYNALNLKNFNKDSNSIEIFCNNNAYAIPVFDGFITRTTFFSLHEIHEFFKNKKKYKYNISENEEYYLIEYVYKPNFNSLSYKITLTVDKELKSIVSFNKTLINKKNNIVNVGLTNTKIIQSFKFNKYDEAFIFKKNKDDVLDFVSQNIRIEYDLLKKKGIERKFQYNAVIEPTPSVEFNKNDLIDLKDLLLY